MWRRVSHCPVCPPAERLWHAGLNHDGSRCLLLADCPELIVWDVRGRCVECVRGGSEPQPDSVGGFDLRRRTWPLGAWAPGPKPWQGVDYFELLRRTWPSVVWAPGPEPPQAYGWHDLSQVLEPGNFYVIAEGPGADRYRVFGIQDPGRTVDERSGLRLEVDRPAGLVRVHRLADGVEVDALRYERSSGAYEVASFSEDGSMFAVIEPYDVTFFAP